MLDLASGFYQAAIHGDFIPLTTIITSAGPYEFGRVPVEASGAPRHFQLLMAKVCEGLERVQLYLDDLVVHTLTAAEHVVVFGKSLERLKIHNRKLAPKKANIGAAEEEFLGHLITPLGRSSSDEKTTALKT